MNLDINLHARDHVGPSLFLKKFLFWLEVLSILGTVRNAVDPLQAPASWLEVR